MKLICTKGSIELLKRLNGSGLKWFSGKPLSESIPTFKYFYLYFGGDDEDAEYLTYSICDCDCDYDNATEVSNNEFVATVYKYFGKAEKMELVPGVTEVYASNMSFDDAIEDKFKHIYLGTFSDIHLCVKIGYENEFESGISFDTNCWKYIVPLDSIPEPVEELTLEEVCEQLGKKIKIVERKA